ncbi:hypothetical protein M5K25_020403 [Dendrobium thyrsiflorum]|uniref:Uncharacterized protein n=1 Tax=Dendrobium thyrsiflorum TaxID=117978 RepID=A0ABD0U9S3_DENTH
MPPARTMPMDLIADGLRNRSPEHKAAIVAVVERHIWPAIEAGKVKPVVYKMLALSEAAEVHRIIERSIHIGKIILVP